MVLPLLLAAALSGAPGPAATPTAAPLPTPRPARGDGIAPAAASGDLEATHQEWEPEWEEEEEEEERRPRVLLSVWGGSALADFGSGSGSGFFSGEAAWAFDAFDLGIPGAAYRSLEDAERTWTPVLLARITQRFATRRGFEATFGFGFGAGRPDGWKGWYQVALGIRVPLGPLFLGGELAFERDLLRLGAGLGVAF